LTETQFIEENKKHWEQLENLLDQNVKDPDKLHDLFVKVSSDLAYASTFYPKRTVRAYLNQLAQRVFDSMEKKKTEWSYEPIKNFFQNILPAEMYASRKALLTSFIVFTIALLIGVVSTAHDPSYPTVILGERYIEVTEKNIDNNDPMAIYKDSEQAGMFLQITVNNIRVSFLCFILGIFGAFGTIIVLFHNGVMLGAFQYYFYSKGLFMESFLTIWIHGTIEISAIIIAGAAGIVLGNGILFPSTYDRGTSMQMAAKRAVRIIIGIVPLFVIAGFLESFVTRYTGMPTFLKITIIGLSLLFVLGLYVIYPWWHNKNSDHEKNTYGVIPNETNPLEFERLKYRNLSQNIYLGFAQFRLNMGKYFSSGLNFLILFAITSFVLYQWIWSPNAYYESAETLLVNISIGGYPLFFVYWFISTFAMMILTMIYREENMTLLNIMVNMKMYFTNMLLIAILPISIFYFTSFAWMLLIFLIIPPPFIAYTFYMVPEKNWKVWTELNEYYSYAFSNWGRTFITFSLIAFLHFLIVKAMDGIVGQFFLSFISWHDIFSGLNVTHVIIMTSIYTFLYLFMLPLYFYVFINQINSERAKQNATDLWKRLEGFNKQSNLLESTS